METIKNYTDLNQSKKLAEFLPFESADLHYNNVSIKGTNYVDEYRAELMDYNTAQKVLSKYLVNPMFGIIPCWSLAVLLDLLPNEIITDNRFECHYQIHIRKYDGGDNTTLYQIAYGNNRGSSGSWHDMINTGEKESLIDCCVQMIIKLNELKML